MRDKKKITVVGAGYVGMSLSVLLAQKNNVYVYDIDEDRVQTINSGRSTIHDELINDYLRDGGLSIKATTDKEQAYNDAEFIVIATPTDFDEDTRELDTTSVESVIEEILDINSKCLIVIKSTIPVGHTSFLREKYSSDKIIFSPEFLREGNALMDNLYPSRIIIGGDCEQSKYFAKLLLEGAKTKDINPTFVKSSDAEAIKLFSNTFLAMRVAFFNELDTFAMVNNLNVTNIIEGVSSDPRIGTGYNNPSFGYGGYCLPKDTKQLLANYEKVPQTLIQAIISSNSLRKDFIAEQIAVKGLKTIGFYRLIMKVNSDNFRTSAIICIMQRMKKKGLKIIVYEPLIQDATMFSDYELLTDIEAFKARSDLIVANRKSDELNDVQSKLFTRDIFGEN